uniref:Uncharacterized protein n=1 Tax=Pan troglodytes TaxID=9598 RepID=A0A2I3TQE6_PANTR
MFVNEAVCRRAKKGVCVSTIPHQRNQISLEKWIPLLEQEKDKMNLEHLVTEFKRCS